jgi:hypothetical protein
VNRSLVVAATYTEWARLQLDGSQLNIGGLGVGGPEYSTGRY